MVRCHLCGVEGQGFQPYGMFQELLCPKCEYRETHGDEPECCEYCQGEGSVPRRMTYWGDPGWTVETLCRECQGTGIARGGEYGAD